MKRTIKIIIFAILFVFLVFLVENLVRQRASMKAGSPERIFEEKSPTAAGLMPLLLNGERILVEVADTDALRTRGLSFRDELSSDRGMLFVLPSSEYAGFWMKDMKFSIDIIWLDEKKKIAHIEQAVSPESFPRIFYPDKKSLYVIEVPAGFSQKHNLRVGDPISF